MLGRDIGDLLSGLATSPCAEAMLMIRPQPFAFITGIAAFMPWNTPDMLIAMIWSHRSVGKSSTLARELDARHC